ncbi:MAG: substrate-binding domain-containing protein, partial [Clostridiales bacterium]|nr:substrate-binding domain-containing protein [Clostridiales bacterium]
MKIKWVWITLLLMALMTGCTAEPSEPVEDDVIKIGISFDSFVVERWQREMEILVATATELGAKVDVQIANEDIEKQIEQIRYLIAQNVDVLIIVPKDAEALSPAIDEAYRNGIKIIAYDRLIIHPDLDLYISFDNEAIGENISERLIGALKLEEEAPPKQILIINGDPSDNNSSLLNIGFHKKIDPLIEIGEVEILEEIWANEWREQYAKDVVENHLSLGHHIDGIIAANDVLATGAIEVLSKWQMAGDVFVVSQDAELSACQRIVEGTQLATVFKPINELAITTAKIAIEMAKGNKVDT